MPSGSSGHGAERVLSLKQTVRRTGIRRYELLELERGSVLGEVKRCPRGRRVYSERQIQTLECVARLHLTLGLTFEEAGLIAAEIDGREPTVPVPARKLQQLMAEAMDGSDLRARVARELAELLRVRAGQMEDVSAA